MKKLKIHNAPKATRKPRSFGSQEQPVAASWHTLDMQQQQQGPGTMSAEEFQTEVLNQTKSTAEAVRKQKEELTLKFDQLDKKTKDTFEELTKQKNNFDGLSSDVASVSATMKKLQQQLGAERRAAFGDPVRRLCGNEEVRNHLNGLVRMGAKIAMSGEHKAALGEVLQKALDEGSTPGSTYLRNELAREIYDALPEYGIWNTLMVEPLGTKTMSLPVDTADPIAQFVDEGASIDDDANITGTSVTATAKKIATLIKISRELLADSEYDVTSRVLRKFLRATAKRMDYAAFRADGTSDATNGGFTGVFNFGTVITAASGNTTVETLDFEDVTATVLGAAEAVLTRQSRWWMHPFILIRMLSIKDGNGRPIFLTALEAPAAGSVGSILGYPITLGHILPTTNSAGNKVAAFGDPDAYTIPLRQDIEWAASEHAAFASDQTVFRMIARAAFKGRLATALTILKTAAS